MNATTKTTPKTVSVNPHRLQSGYWCHERNKTLDKGDINAGYSADLIGMEGRVRNPFRLQGWLCVVTSMSNRPTLNATGYRLISTAFFEGTPTTYGDKLVSNNGDDARNDPHGFYHGMLVKHGGQEYVMAGPPICIVVGEPEPTQAELF